MNTAVKPALWPHDVARNWPHGTAAVVAGLMIFCLTCTLAEGQTRPRARPDAQTADQPSQPSGGQTSTDQPDTFAPKPRPLPVQPDADIATTAAAMPQKGPVTGQPLPRFVSLKGGEGNARRGPGLTHRIDWVFTTAGTPLRVTAEYENWRRVEDFEGLGGWVHFALLSGARYVMVTQDMASFYRLPDASLPIAFQAERGVLARLLECSADWCRVNADGQRGWAPKTALWGVDGAEVLD